MTQRVKHLPAMQETRVRSLSQEDPLEKEMEPTPVFLPGEPHGQRSLVVFSPRGCKESDTTKQLSMHSRTEQSRNCNEGNACIQGAMGAEMKPVKKRGRG